MKKIYLLLLLLVLGVNSFAIIITPILNQTQYRWRNDDGNETAATWKAAINTPIVVSTTTETLRLRLEFSNSSGLAANVEETLEYSSNNGVSWTAVTAATTNAFVYINSPNVANAAATTNQFGTTTTGTFVAGKVISAVSAATPLALPDLSKTEYEFVIKPTDNILPFATYLFRTSNQGSTPNQYGRLTTTCVGVSVASTQGAARCGSGTVTLNATPSATSTINWYDSQLGGNLLASGNTFTTPVLNTTTTYYVAAANQSCESPRQQVVATINPIPAVNLGADQTVCQGDNAIFNAGSVGISSYLWDNGSTIQTRTVSQPGTYYVTVTGAGGCKNSDTIKLFNNPRPVVNIGSDTAICPGASIVLNAGNPGMQYLWSNGVTSQTNTVGTGGVHSVVVTNQYNCTGSDSMSLLIKAQPLGDINAVHGDTATYTFDVVNAMYAIGYTWNFGDGSPEVQAFQAQHKYTTNGVYVVTLGLVSDCGNSVIKTRTIDVFDATGGTGIDNVELKNAMNIYPNPATDELNIKLASGLNASSIIVYNLLGKRVLALDVNSNNETINLNTKELNSGIYTVKVNTNKGTVVHKIQITRY